MYIVIAGGGKIGEYLAGIMLRVGNEVVVIEQDEQTADHLASVLSGKYLIINGDGCMSRYQEDADIRKADVFVAVTGQDDTNLMACEIAQRVFGVQRCIARVNSPKNLHIFREVGIECVSSTSIIATMIEEEAMLGGISVLSSLTHGNVALKEVTVPRMRYHSNEEGVLAGDIELPPGCLMISVSRNDEDGMEIIDSETVLHSGDAIVVAAYSDQIDRVPAALKAL